MIRLIDLFEDLSVDRPLYHGTYQTGAFHKIIRDGLVGRVAQERYKLAPMKGRVYMTPQLRYAIIYAIGGSMMGHKLPDYMIKPGERYGYVFEIDPNDLSDDILPDEDIVGQALVAAYKFKKTGKHNEFSDLDVELLNYPRLMSDLAYMFDTYTQNVPTIRRGALEGAISDQARLGKRVLKYGGADISIKALLRLNTTHQSHAGTVMPVRAWRIDRRLTPKLAKDGSNFFDLAKPIWQRSSLVPIS